MVEETIKNIVAIATKNFKKSNIFWKLVENWVFLWIKLRYFRYIPNELNFLNYIDGDKVWHFPLKVMPVKWNILTVKVLNTNFSFKRNNSLSILINKQVY